MQQDLSAAIRARDVVRVKALRTALAALANAEAVDVATVASGTGPAGTEVTRRFLSDTDIRMIVIDEIGELRRSAAEFRLLEQAAVADGLDAQAAFLETYLD